MNATFFLFSLYEFVSPHTVRCRTRETTPTLVRYSGFAALDGIDRLG